MENTKISVVPYVTTAARLALDSLVAAYRKIQPGKSVNFFLWGMFQLALKDPSLSHDGPKDLQIKQLGRAYVLDNAHDRLFSGDDIGIDNLALLLTDIDAERPKKKPRCCRSDWFQAIIRSGISVAEQRGTPKRVVIERWVEAFLSAAEQHSEGRAPLVNRFREVLKVICGTPDLVDLMSLLKRQPLKQIVQEADESFAEVEQLLEQVPEAAPETPETSKLAEPSPVTILENPYNFDWEVFSSRIQDWPRVFVLGRSVYFISRTYLDERHRRVYEGGHIFTHKNGVRNRQSVHELPLIMQVKVSGRFEMKYTVTALDCEQAIGICGKVWKNTDGQGDEISLYKWFVVTRAKEPTINQLPLVTLVNQSQFNGFSEAMLKKYQPAPQTHVLQP